nr:T9SS type A sorting domain-containing protein [Fulvivirga marina]
MNNSKAQADWYYVGDVKTLPAGQKNGESWYVNSGDARLNQTSLPMTVTNLYGESAPEQTFSNSVKKQPVLLIGNYPNPAGSQTTIHYVLAEQSQVNISITDLQGNLVKDIMGKSQQGAGIYALQVNIADLKPGIYLYEVNTKNQKVLRRMIVK